MEKFSKWRDPATGIAPFLYPLPASTDTLPTPLTLLAAPVTWTLAAVRTVLILALLLVNFVLVEIIFSVCLVAPPLYAVLSRVTSAVSSRCCLAILGFVWIPVERVSLRRTGRSPPPLVFAPGKGDIIVANSSSICDLLYLSFRYNPTFLLPVSSTGSKSSASSSAKITSWRRVSLLTAIFSCGSLPERSERGESLEVASKAARGPVVIFPEGTTSNNRALLKFAAILETYGSKPPTYQTYVLSFRYDLPTNLSPSITLPIPSPLSPFKDIFMASTSPFLRHLQVRQLNPSESPTLSSSPKLLEWESLADTLAATGRWKRTGSDWEAKESFLKFRAARR